MSCLKRMLLTGFGLGCLPVAPGTWGSLPPMVVFALMCYLGMPLALITLVMAVFVLAGSFVCIRFSGELVAELGKKDPSQIVADEFAGQAIVFILTLTAVSSAKMAVVTAIAGFFLFRLFDIIKPWPIKKLEKLPNGWGILCDDLLAGIYALIVLTVFLLLL